MSWYTPATEISEEQRGVGLRFLFYDGLCSHAMTLLVTGAFLPGMALALGADNFVIGILASLAPISQMVQIPAILLVDKVGLRKLLTVVMALVSRTALLCVVLVPFFVPSAVQVPIFMLLMVIFFIGGSVAGCASNSWIKDIIPEVTRGRYLAGRLAAATALGASLTILAGFGIDGLTDVLGEPSRAYAVIFFVAAIFGMCGIKLLSKVPEPQLPERDANANWLASLLEPLKDPNFRRLLVFSGSWSFTIIMAGAFFAVYMLQRIGLPMSTVILLAVLSQAINVYFFRVWGRIADRYSNKSVLRAALPLYILLILLYPFTTLPERYAMTLPLLVFIHIIGGISTAGFTLCSSNIALRLAPHGKATAYLGANAFCTGLAATVAPIVGGLIGTYFASREISIKLFYNADTAVTGDTWSIPAMSFRGLDFVFFTAALVGLYAWHRLSLVDEEGTVSEAEVRDEVLASMRQSLSSASSFSYGVRRMSAFPYELLLRTGKTTKSTLYRAAKSTMDITRRHE